MMEKRQIEQSMPAANKTNNSALPSIEQASSSTPASTREAFLTWLSTSSAEKYHPQSSVACLDRISEYVINKKISCSIWEISEPNAFLLVYRKVMNATLLKIMERNTYKTFTFVGQLYMDFLKETFCKTTLITPTNTTPHNEPNIQNKSESNNDILEPEIILNNSFLFKKNIDLSLFKYTFATRYTKTTPFRPNTSAEIPCVCGGGGGITIASITAI